MEARSLKYLAEGCGGQLRGGAPGTLVGGVCTDSREAQPGDLFIALAGERFDGHDFLPQAAGKGAAVLVMGFSRAAALPAGCAAILVDDTRQALGKLAARYRRDFDLPIVAVAGSNGKTTTKELLAAVLRQKWPTLASSASFNNDIGVPLTLLNLRHEHRAAVLEVGTNHPGELAPLVRMIRPQFGVLTSLGREHLEFFGDLHGVAQEEGWLAELLPADGKLFVHGDSPLIAEVSRRSRAPVVRVGLGHQNDWVAKDLRLDAAGSTFHVHAPDGLFSGEYRLHLLGRHQLANALLAIAVAAELGLNRAEIQRGLAECRPAKMRLQLRSVSGVQVLDDAYNANADSMLAALQTLHDLPCTGRRVAVLGDMAEQGEHSGPAHEEIGRRAAELGIGRLYAVGKNAAVLAASARAAGLRDVAEFSDAVAAGRAVRADVVCGDLVLVKASRAACLEQVVELLLGSGDSGRGSRVSDLGSRVLGLGSGAGNPDPRAWTLDPNRSL